jgi:uncharacterized protein (TIGR02145 family)
VPTDYEWGVILDGMEENTSTEHQNASGSNWYGKNAGSRAKSSCMCEKGSDCVDDAKAYWNNASNTGTDNYGFRVLPAGYRSNNGSYFSSRGSYAYFWSSTRYSSTRAWYRGFYYSSTTVYRYYTTPSSGYSVRCVHD